MDSRKRSQPKAATYKDAASASAVCSLSGGREGVVGMYYRTHTLLFYSQDFCSPLLLETGPELGSWSDSGWLFHTLGLGNIAAGQTQ